MKGNLRNILVASAGGAALLLAGGFVALKAPDPDIAHEAGELQHAKAELSALGVGLNEAWLAEKYPYHESKNALTDYGMAISTAMAVGFDKVHAVDVACSHVETQGAEIPPMPDLAPFGPALAAIDRALKRETCMASPHERARDSADTFPEISHIKAFGKLEGALAVWAAQRGDWPEFHRRLAAMSRMADQVGGGYGFVGLLSRSSIQIARYKYIDKALAVRPLSARLVKEVLDEAQRPVGPADYPKALDFEFLAEYRDFSSSAKLAPPSDPLDDWRPNAEAQATEARFLQYWQPVLQAVHTAPDDWQGVVAQFEAQDRAYVKGKDRSFDWVKEVVGTGRATVYQSGRVASRRLQSICLAQVAGQWLANHELPAKLPGHVSDIPDGRPFQYLQKGGKAYVWSEDEGNNLPDAGGLPQIYSEFKPGS